MSITTDDLKLIEEKAGYGAKACVYLSESGLCIEVGKVYEDFGWFGGRFYMTEEEVDNSSKEDIEHIASEAEKQFNAALGGRFLK